MSRSCLHDTIHLAIAVSAAAAIAGCERPSKQEAGHKAPAVMRVEVVKPERHTVQRAVGEPVRPRQLDLARAVDADHSGEALGCGERVDSVAERGQRVDRHVSS